MMNLMMNFMPNWLANTIWAYPICEVIDCLIKLPALHTTEMQCQALCDLTNCDWRDQCEKTPECCRK